MGKCILCLGISLFLGTSTVQGKIISTLPKALGELFPGASSEREVLYLAVDEKKRIAELSGAAFDRGVVFRYRVLRKTGELLGTAYLDKHRVRSKPETILVVVKPDGRVHRLRIMSFAEPLEYMPREAWYRQFDDKELGKSLRLRRDIDGITGATLSASAATGCARRVLAIHDVLADRDRENGK